AVVIGQVELPLKILLQRLGQTCE
ncbi:hypothetical protein CCACVL1_27567, partial [Corchorus capsularis]